MTAHLVHVLSEDPLISRLIGPFPDRQEASAWGIEHLSDFRWMIHPLVSPQAHLQEERWPR